MASRYEVHVTDPSRSHLSPNVLQNLKLKTFAVPEPGPGSVLVRMRAAAFNFRDILVLAGSPVYPISTVDGLVPIVDGAGEIVKAGPNSIWKDKIGESVILVPTKDWMDGDSEAFNKNNTMGAGDVPGVLSQYVVVEDKLVIPAPKNLSWEESAALVSAAATAINVLQSIEIKKGTTIVTQGTGGVSCAVIQYAAALGAKVIATSSTAEKLQIAKNLGASELVNYRTSPDWAGEVIRLTGGRGADLVCDVAGWGTMEASIKATRQGGTTCLVGMLTPPQPTDVLMPLIMGGKTLKGILMYSKKMLERAVALAEEYDIHPYIHESFAWEDVPKGFERLQSQSFVGKLTIKV